MACDKCDPVYCTYQDTHELVVPVAESSGILGVPQKMCEGIYHVFPAPEYAIEKHGCIDGYEHDVCRPTALTMVVMCGDMVGRFTNCRSKHAEEFLIHNRQMLHYIRTARPRSMKIFLKHHFCHHSRGNARRHKDGSFMQGRTDPKSCTEQMIRYNDTVLKPNGVTLVVRVAWLYKAFWRGCEREDDKVASQNSLTGLQMQLAAGIDVQAMSLSDWLLLANMCTEPIQLKHLWQPLRLTADRETQKFIMQHTKRKRDAEC